MQGFDKGFRDLPDYIEKITREIWEERGIGRSLDKYYARDILVRAPPGITTSSEGVVAATLGTLHEFPDRRLVFEDVIWSGNEVDGFLSSHRLISVMRKQGDGPHGPASGRGGIKNGSYAARRSWPMVLRNASMVTGLLRTTSTACG